ncbi:MAG TPA: hypothetical protein VF603_02800 [Allosphingosinicella sp.]|jgi:hypothetical protein
MVGERERGGPRQRYVRATQWRRRRFFALLEETGQVRLAAELSGLGLGCIYRLRRIEAGFGERMIAARVAASERLDGRAAAEGPGAGAGDGLVVRRGPGGRLRAVAPHRGWWGERDDEVFLGALRETGSVTAACRVAGFCTRTAYNRRKRLPGFAASWKEALAEAPPRLEARMLAEGMKLVVRERWDEPGDAVPFDPAAAIRIFGWLDKRARRG